MEKDIVFWGFYLIYFRVIILGHNRVFEGKNLIMLFVHFLRSFNKWECAFKKYCLFTFLIFLITGKIISTSLLCFLIINFAIILYFKTFIKFKSNYQRSLKLPKQKSHINFNFLLSNVKGLQSSKKRLKQFEYFKSKLKPNGLLFLQETHSTIACEKKWKDEFGGDLHFSHGSSNSCGVLIAFYGNQDITVKKKLSDKKG